MLKNISSKYVGQTTSNEFINDAFGSGVNGFFHVLLIILFFTQSTMTFSLYGDEVGNLVAGEIPDKTIIMILSIVVAICSYCGIEGVTRQGYISFMLIVLFFILMCFSAYEGINTDNLYPVLGKTFKGSFLNPIYLILCASFTPVFLISDMFKEKDMKIKCMKRVNTYVFLISFVLALLYILTVPYPIGAKFENSIKAVFLCIGSGEIIHRFEIFLLLLYLVCAVQSSTFAVCICSEKLSDITKTNDIKPYVLILTVIMYCVANYKIPINIYLSVTAVLAVIYFLYPLVLWLAGRNVRYKNEV